jgi:hypothetical protein
MPDWYWVALLKEKKKYITLYFFVKNYYCSPLKNNLQVFMDLCENVMINHTGTLSQKFQQLI